MIPTPGETSGGRRWIELPAATEVRPDSYPSLAASSEALAGNRFRYPAHVHQRRSGRGHGEKSDVWGPTGERIDTRQSVIDLWQAALQ